MGTRTSVSYRRGTVQVEQELITLDKELQLSDVAQDQNIATDAKTFTLPLITADNLGANYIFRNTGADAAIALTISPNALDAIHGTVANAAADSVAGGVVNKNIVLTKATANKGDYLVLVAVSLTEWYISGGVGIWASEA